MDDIDLLRDYVRGRSEQCFRELVDRKLPLVYSAALRQVGGDVHLARDVAQMVFIALARQSPSLLQHPSLGGWLYKTTRNTAQAAMRAARRRRRREYEAHFMEANDSGTAEDEWTRIAAVLDEEMHGLNSADREILLLRYFEQQSLGAVGRRIGLSEEAARKRIARALDRLENALVRRGVVPAGSGLGATLAQGAVTNVPAGLAVATSGAALTAAALGGAASGVGLIIMSKITLAATAAALALGLFAVFLTADRQLQAESAERTAGQDRTISELRRDIAVLRGNRPPLGAMAPEPAQPAAPAAQDEVLNQLAALSDAVNRGGIADRISWEKPTLRETLATIGNALGLSSEQLAAIQTIGDRVSSEIEANALRGATVTRLAASINIETREFPENQAAYSRMLEEFAQILGPVRFGLYESLNAKQSVESVLRKGGLGADSVSFQYNARMDSYGAGLNGRPGNQIGLPPGNLRGWPSVHANPNPLMLGSMRASSREEAKASIGYLGALVPDDF